MSSGPSTFGIMITSRASPASVTAAITSSRTHGESSELTRVHSWVSGLSQLLAISTNPARALSFSDAGMASSRLASSTSTVGAMSGTLPTIFGLCGGRKWMTREGRNGMSRSGSGAPIASGRKKSFGGRTPEGYAPPPAVRQSAAVADRASRPHTGRVRDRRFAPLWVYFFGLFALAFLQRFTFPPDEHSVAANVLFFTVGAVVVIVVLTIVQRRSNR